MGRGGQQQSAHTPDTGGGRGLAVCMQRQQQEVAAAPVVPVLRSLVACVRHGSSGSSRYTVSEHHRPYCLFNHLRMCVATCVCVWSSVDAYVCSIFGKTPTLLLYDDAGTQVGVVPVCLCAHRG